MYIVHTLEPEETVVDIDDCHLQRQCVSDSLVLEIANRGSHGWEQRHLGVTKEIGGQK